LYPKQTCVKLFDMRIYRAVSTYKWFSPNVTPIVRFAGPVVYGRYKSTAVFNVDLSKKLSIFQSISFVTNKMSMIK
jgi:hypothetical protein